MRVPNFQCDLTLRPRREASPMVRLGVIFPNVTNPNSRHIQLSSRGLGVRQMSEKGHEETAVLRTFETSCLL